MFIPAPFKLNESEAYDVIRENGFATLFSLHEACRLQPICRCW